MCLLDSSLLDSIQAGDNPLFGSAEFALSGICQPLRTPAQSVRGATALATPARMVLTADPAFKAQFVEQGQQAGVVQFTNVGFLTRWHAGDLDVTNAPGQKIFGNILGA